jgi:hypothetical protein
MGDLSRYALPLFAGLLGAYLLYLVAEMLATRPRLTGEERRRSREPGGIVACGCPHAERSSLPAPTSRHAANGLQVDRLTEQFRTLGCPRVWVILDPPRTGRGHRR